MSLSARPREHRQLTADPGMGATGGGLPRVWTARAYRGLVGFALVLGCYWLYTLLVVPLMEPPELGINPRGLSPQEIERAQERFRRYRERLLPLFTEGTWHLDKTKIIETEDVTVLLEEYEKIDDLRVRVWPCAGVIGATHDEETQRIRTALVIEAPEGAVVEFEGPVDLRLGQIRQPRRVELHGPVRLRQFMADVPPDQLLLLETEDLSIEGQRISTEGEVRFRFGPHFGKGRGLVVELGNLPDLEESPRAEVATRAISEVRVSRVERLHVVLPATRRVGASPQVGTNQPIAFEVACDGPFRFQPDKLRANFEGNVRGWRVGVGARDELRCEELVLWLASESEASAGASQDVARDPSAGTSDEQAAGKPSPQRAMARTEQHSPKTGGENLGAPMPAIGPGFVGWEIRRVQMRGGPATIRAPTWEFSFEGNFLEYDLESGQYFLSSEERTTVRYGGVRIVAGKLRGRLPFEALGTGWTQAEAELIGPGSLSHTFREQTSPQIVAQWEGRLYIRPQDGRQVLSLVQGASIHSANVGTLSAEEVHIWLLPPESSDKAAKSAILTDPLQSLPLPKPPGARDSLPAETLVHIGGLRPERLLALGNVVIEVPQAQARAEELRVIFDLEIQGQLPGMSSITPGEEDEFDTFREKYDHFWSKSRLSEELPHHLARWEKDRALTPPDRSPLFAGQNRVSGRVEITPLAGTQPNPVRPGSVAPAGHSPITIGEEPARSTKPHQSGDINQLEGGLLHGLVLLLDQIVGPGNPRILSAAGDPRGLFRPVQLTSRQVATSEPASGNPETLPEASSGLSPPAHPPEGGNPSFAGGYGTTQGIAAAVGPGSDSDLSGGKGPELSSRFDISASRIHVRLRAKTSGLECAEALLEGKVQLVESVSPASPDPTHRPALLTGQRVYLVDPGTVYWSVLVEGQPGHVEARGLALTAPRIALNAASNRLWVDQGGRLELWLKPTGQWGAQSAATVPVVVRWGAAMVFTGQVARFDGSVVAEVPGASLVTEELEVHLVDLLTFAGADWAAQPRLDQLRCAGPTVLARTAEGQGPSGGGSQMLSDRLEVSGLVVWWETGEFRAGGPGRLITRLPAARAGSGELPGLVPLSGPGVRGREVAHPPAGVPINSSDSATENISAVSRAPETGAILVFRFVQDLRGNLWQRRVAVQGHVRGIYVANWPWNWAPEPDEPTDPPAGGVRFSAGSITAVELSPPGQERCWELVAEDNVRLEGQDFVARAPRASYVQSKDLLVLEGAPRNPAELYRQTRPGEPPVAHAATRILYWLGQRRLVVEGFQTLQVP